MNEAEELEENEPEKKEQKLSRKVGKLCAWQYANTVQTKRATSLEDTQRRNCFRLVQTKYIFHYFACLITHFRYFALFVKTSKLIK